MKQVTRNVNGIRAREADVAACVAREKPDVLCLQELKALPEQIPEPLTTLPDYWNYWHGSKGYSGVSLHVSKAFAPDQPRFLHPEFDHETRIVIGDLGHMSIASIYVPNGGKDYASKVRFLRAMADHPGVALRRVDVDLRAGHVHVAAHDQLPADGPRRLGVDGHCAQEAALAGVVLAPVGDVDRRDRHVPQVADHDARLVVELGVQEAGLIRSERLADVQADARVALAAVPVVPVVGQGGQRLRDLLRQRLQLLQAQHIGLFARDEGRHVGLAGPDAVHVPRHQLHGTVTVAGVSL